MPEEPQPAPHFTRLTHLQWEFSVRDLLRLDVTTGASSTFIGDAVGGSGYTTDTELLDVTPDLWNDYQRAAEDVARAVARDPVLLEAILPAGTLPSEGFGTDVCQEAVTNLDDELAPCCDGGGSCVPLGGWPSTLQSEMALCDDGGACLPNDIVNVMAQSEGSWVDAWSLWRKPCVSTADQEGTCMSTCFPRVEASADVLPQDVCADGERCVPCIDPLTPESSGACEEGWGCASFESEEALAAIRAARDAFLVDFGRRAFRRPLEAAELVSYAALFDQGSDLLETSDRFAAGVEITLTAMLQSPYFLYRVERSTEVGPDGRVMLDGWEIATRLSYTLWNTTPSDELLHAAETGVLDTREAAQQWILDMLADPRSASVVDDFHGQYMHAGDYRDIQKQPGLFPNFTEGVGVHMHTELELFVKDVVIASEGGLSELLLSPHSFVNRDLAVIYGLDGADFGEEFVRVDLDPTERQGLLTRLGFLADRAGPRPPEPDRSGVAPGRGSPVHDPAASAPE